MSIKYVENAYGKFRPEPFCDGPKHTGERRLEDFVLSLDHEYLQTDDFELNRNNLDAYERHFCTFGCLYQWVEKEKGERTGVRGFIEMCWNWFTG